MSALRIIHITDLHLRSNDAVVILRDMMFRMQAKYKADAIFVTGDIVASTAEDWQHIGAAYKQLWQDLAVPVFQCPGNHDIYSYADGSNNVLPYEEFCGPHNYCTLFKDFCIVGHNSMSGHSQQRQRQWERDRKEYGCNEQYRTQGSMTPAEFTKLRKKAGAKPIIILQHLVPCQPEMMRAQVAGVTAIFSGHWHASKIHAYKNCISYNSPNPLFGGFDGSQAGCLIVDFKQDGSSRAQFHAKEAIVPVVIKVKRSDYRWCKQFPGTTERSAIVTSVASGDTLYFTTWDRSGLQHNVCYALSAKDGSLLWKRKTAQAIKRSLISVGDLIIGNGYGGTVYAMDAQTGKIRWTAAVGNGVDRFLNSSPISNGSSGSSGNNSRGHILTGNYHSFACLDVRDGSVIWQRRLGTEFPTTCVQPVYDATSNCLIILQKYQAALTAKIKSREVTGVFPIVDAASGEIVHLHKDQVVNAYTLTPCVHDGLLYSAHRKLSCCRLGSNTIVWQREFRGHIAGALYMSQQGLLSPTDDGWVLMIDPKNGREKWSVQLGLTPGIAQIEAKSNYASISDITEKGAHIYFTAQDQHLYKVHTASGKMKAKIPLPAMSLCKPLIRKEGIFVSDYDGNVHCLKSIS
ncbi:MAG: PQQ-binding-like beta-propeller repeat protein [Planctomycetes bacterium]|nr:PQQ-binding-like beta-propeller repeat protein [Planctomycetota bacterium]